jgi:hypothetical protein
MALADLDHTDPATGWHVNVRGALAGTGARTHAGYFEHEERGVEGMLWFQANALVAYDGVFALPRPVIAALLTHGFVLSQLIAESHGLVPRRRD